MADSNASVLIPRFKYYTQTVTITDGSNDELGFYETTAGSVLTATIEAGTWSYGQLAYKVKVALEAAGDSVYTVRYDYSARKFTLTSDGAGGGNDFEIDYASAGLDDGWPTLGFTADTSGALTYTSDTAAPSQTTFDFSRNLRFVSMSRIANRADTELGNGRVVGTGFGAHNEYRFRAEYETVAVAQGFYDMVSELAEWGGSAEFYPDSATAKYMDVTFPNNTWSIREMTAEGLYRLYAIELTVRENAASDQTGTLSLRSLIDRRPSS
jgi:hypothetical protein